MATQPADGLTHAGRHVLEALEELRDDGGKWATRYELASAAGVSSRTALRALQAMEARGLLDVDSVRGQQYGINTPTLYRLRERVPALTG